MPSSDLDDARFTDVDWESGSAGPVDRLRPDRRTAGLLVAVAVIAVMYVYDYLVAPPELITVLNWDLTRTDWLFLLSLVLFARYVVVPALANRSLSARRMRQILSRPAGAISLGFILLFVVTSVIGPDALSTQEWARLKHKLQPPVYTRVWVGDQFYYNCVGKMENGYCHGTWKYPLGTTRFGEDIVKLVLEGTRIGLFLGLTTATIMAVVATAVGTISGYFRGWIDAALMWYVDIQQTIPAIVVYFILATMYFGNLSEVTDGGMFVFVLVFGLLDWGGIARLVRSDVLRRRSAGYVRAARAAGASDLQVIRRHVIPNSTATVVTALTRRIPLLILAQTFLAYLSLNRIKSRSFGRMLRIGLETPSMPWHRKWWITVTAVVFLVGLVLAFNLLGDVLRDVLDPTEDTRR